MKNQLILLTTLFTLFALVACNHQKPLYKSDAFEMDKHQIKQGDFRVDAESPSSMTSNYISPYKKATSKVLDFKFALNGEDNERYPGEDHHLFLETSNGILVSDIYTFGAPDPIQAIIPDDRRGEVLPADVSLTIKVDMNPVLSSFKARGYYTLFNGEQFSADDYKGVFIAGNTLPLSWDFANLPSHPELELSDADDDGIYELEFAIKKYQQVEAGMGTRTWVSNNNEADYPSYISDMPITEAMYNMSLDELKMDIRSDSAFMAGAKWPGVWTRDISYSILLSLAILEPEVAKKSLLHKVQNSRIIQDTGTGGSWPVSTDRMTWSLAAWEIYTVTGDPVWLDQAYEIIRKSAEDDLLTIIDPKTGLMYGESSFLDWREQSYPDWMDPKDIYRSQSLGTNLVHFKTYSILSEMAGLLQDTAAQAKYHRVATALKDAINEYMWLEEQGYYAQYRYGRTYQAASPRSETLGEAMSILFGVASKDQAQNIIASTPTTAFGTPCFYPQIPDLPPYHNNGIWPFVEAYWGWAAARAGNAASVEHSIASIYRPAGLFLSNKENMVAETGDYMGTEINSDRQLWSVAGNLAIVYRIFFGMEFSPSGLQLQPFIPENYAGKRSLNNFKYRNSSLDISIEGYGSKIASITLDGEQLQKAFIPADLAGKHQVSIQMNNHIEPSAINVLPVSFTPTTPEVFVKDGILSWEVVHGATQYDIYQNGQLKTTVKLPNFTVGQNNTYSEYQVLARDSGGLESFLSEPVVGTTGPSQIIKPESDQVATEYDGFTGNGYTELSKDTNIRISFTFEVDSAGEYAIDFRYGNGHGPINTNNKCAIRSASLDGEYIGAVVLAQRGDRNWTDWGYSNELKTGLTTGIHTLVLEFLPHNENMNTQTNSAVLDYMRISLLN